MLISEVSSRASVEALNSELSASALDRFVVALTGNEAEDSTHAITQKAA
jgi:hypothetical protein